MKNDILHRPLNILLLSHAVSKSWGGEAILPFHVFKNLRKKGLNVWLCAGDENIKELQDILGQDFNRFIPIKQLWFHRVMLWFREKSPNWFPGEVFLFCSILHTSFLQRRALPQLIKQYNIDIVHQTTPVSPKLPTCVNRLTVPFVYGPMNGGMNYPPNLNTHNQSISQIFKKALRLTSHIFNRILSGKINADCLIVANRRTYDSLPFRPVKRVIEFVENGVDLEDWSAVKKNDHSLSQSNCPDTQKSVKFIYIGSLLPGKGAESVLRAFVAISKKSYSTLEIIGDYWDERQRLQILAKTFGIEDKVSLPGFLPQQECFKRLLNSDIFVFPSLIDCGGAVILEAMAAGKPVIALKWGGAVDYINESCGILILPESNEQLLADLKFHMLDLANNPGKRVAMGKAGRKRLEDTFTWSKKIDFYYHLYYSLILNDLNILHQSTAEFSLLQS